VVTEIDDFETHSRLRVDRILGGEDKGVAEAELRGTSSTSTEVTPPAEIRVKPNDSRERGAMEQNSVEATKPVLIPGPDHSITINRNPNRVVVSVDGLVIADTVNALTLREAGYPAVQYIPREDVRMELLERSDRQTYCPYKGDCSYFSIANGDERLVNAVWSYEMPFPAVSEISGYLAFYRDRFDFFEDGRASSR